MYVHSESGSLLNKEPQLESEYDQQNTPNVPHNSFQQSTQEMGPVERLLTKPIDSWIPIRQWMENPSTCTDRLKAYQNAMDDAIAVERADRAKATRKLTRMSKFSIAMDLEYSRAERDSNARRVVELEQEVQRFKEHLEWKSTTCKGMEGEFLRVSNELDAANARLQRLEQSSHNPVDVPYADIWALCNVLSGVLLARGRESKVLDEVANWLEGVQP